MLIDERLCFQKMDRDIYTVLRLKFFWDYKAQNHYEIGHQVSENAIEEGIPLANVTMDGFYGENSELLTELKSKT